MGEFESFLYEKLSRSRQDPPIFEYLYKEQETVRFDEIIRESDLSKSDAFRYLLKNTESSGEDTLVSDDN